MAAQKTANKTPQSMVGRQLGPYQIVALLGAGGMGEVYRAKDGRLGRDVAVKVLPTTFSADTERVARFKQEARAVGQLNHPNILAIFDVGTHDGSPYLVSELLEGETLRDRLRHKALSPLATSLMTAALFLSNPPNHRRNGAALLCFDCLL